MQVQEQDQLGVVGVSRARDKQNKQSHELRGRLGGARKPPSTERLLESPSAVNRVDSLVSTELLHQDGRPGHQSQLSLCHISQEADEKEETASSSSPLALRTRSKNQLSIPMGQVSLLRDRQEALAFGWPWKGKRKAEDGSRCGERPRKSV